MLRRLLCLFVMCLSSAVKSLETRPKNVFVTGAGSSVGFEVFRKLLQKKPRFNPYALVRTTHDARKLIRLGAEPSQIYIGDITQKKDLMGIFRGIDKVVLCTSARPRKTLFYHVKNFFRSLINKGRTPKVTDLYYRKGEEPFDVDFIGQKNVIDEACSENAKAGIHFVMVSNMGGYRNSSKINEIGRRDGDPNSGNILKWKRAAERYLMKRSFFTIVHPGTMTDDPGGRREIVWDNDDSLLRTPFVRIPKQDVAEVCIQALVIKEAIGRSIDIAARAEGTAPATKDWLRFWSIPGNNLYPSDLE